MSVCVCGVQYLKGRHGHVEFGICILFVFLLSEFRHSSPIYNVPGRTGPHSAYIFIADLPINYFLDSLISCLFYKMKTMKNVDRCFPKPKVISTPRRYSAQFNERVKTYFFLKTVKQIN